MLSRRARNSTLGAVDNSGNNQDRSPRGIQIHTIQRITLPASQVAYLLQQAGYQVRIEDDRISITNFVDTKMPTTRSQSLGRGRSPARDRSRSPNESQERATLGAEATIPLSPEMRELLHIITERFQEQQLQIEGICNKLETMALPSTPQQPLIISSTPKQVAGEEPTAQSLEETITSAIAAPTQGTKIFQKSASHHTSHGKRNIARFSGNDPTLHIDAWLRIFEIVMYDKPDDDKKYQVAQYIDGDALTWFANHLIPTIDQKSWTEVKTSLIQRFKTQEVRPLIAAQDRYLNRGENVQKYYDDKMRLLQQTNLHDTDMVSILNRGMPSFYKPHLICADIPSPAKWLATTLELEGAFKRNMAYKAKQPQSDFETMTATSGENQKQTREKKEPNEAMNQPQLWTA